MSSGAAFAYTVNAVMGSGALALPFAVQQAGYVLGPILLALMGFLAYLTLSWHFEVQVRALAVMSAHDDKTVFVVESGATGDASNNSGPVVDRTQYTTPQSTPAHANVTMSRTTIQEYDTVGGSTQRLVQGTSLISTITVLGDAGTSWTLKSILQPGATWEQPDFEDYPSSTYMEIGIVLRLFLGKYATMIWNVCCVVYVFLSLWCYVVVWSTTAMIGIPIHGLTPIYLQCEAGPHSSPECGDAQKIFAGIFFVIAFLMMMRDWSFMPQLQKVMTGLMYTALTIMVITSLVALTERPFPSTTSSGSSSSPTHAPNETTTTAPVATSTADNRSTTDVATTTPRWTTRMPTSDKTTTTATTPSPMTTARPTMPTTSTKAPDTTAAPTTLKPTTKPPAMAADVGNLLSTMLHRAGLLPLPHPKRDDNAAAVQHHRGFRAEEAYIGEHVVAFDATHFSALFGATVFAMLCHTASTLILQTMPSKRATKRVYFSAFSCITIIYIFMALAAAIYMGKNVDTLATHNWSNYAVWGTPNDKGLGYFFGSVVLFYPMISVTATFYVLARALCNSVEDMIPIAKRKSIAAIFPWNDGYKSGQLWPLQFIIRLVLVSVSVALAIGSSSYHQAINFAGLVGFAIMFFFPISLQIASHRLLKQLHLPSTTPYDDVLSHPFVAWFVLVVSIGLFIYYIVTQIVPVF